MATGDVVKMDELDRARIFDQYRDLLQAVSYRVLGRTGDSEDIVQETWLRWSGVNLVEVVNPEGYLVRVATRLAIDRLRSAQARHESYVGPWLPEPMLTSPDIADDVAMADSVSMAMLLVLEALSPLERAVFVLREAFGYSYAEVGEIVGRSETAVRQTARRAREHVEDRRPRYDTDQVVRQKATESFLAAAAGGDLKALMKVLAPEVTLISDGGGLAPAPRKAVHGMEIVARALVTFAGRMPEDPSVSIVQLNGGPGIIVRSGPTPVAAMILNLVDGVVETIHLITNPEKLTGLRFS